MNMDRIQQIVQFCPLFLLGFLLAGKYPAGATRDAEDSYKLPLPRAQWKRSAAHRSPRAALAPHVGRVALLRHAEQGRACRGSTLNVLAPLVAFQLRTRQRALPDGRTLVCQAVAARGQSHLNGQIILPMITTLTTT